jgi:triacylglycerol lipase
MTDTQAAELALLVLYAMDAYLADRESLAPPPDPRLAGRWKVLGYLTAGDALLRRGQTMAFGEDVCYGYVAQQIENPGVYVAAIRGTDGILEWIEDAEFISVPHPVAGRVESGFWEIYESLTYRGVGAAAGVKAAQGLAATVGAAGQLIVLGHSLGSPLATYLTFDLAPALGARVQACLFASPRPGNAEFVKAFDAAVATYHLWNYELDVVPRVPLGPDYTDLPKAHWIGIEAAQARIAFTLAAHHHILCYAAMLDYALLNWTQVPLCDRLYAQCIKGPTRVAA